MILHRLYRFFAALSAAAVLLSLTACSTPFTKDDGTVTITVYDESSSFSGTMKGWFADVLKDAFNVKLQFRTAYGEGFNAYVENGVLGDLIVFDNESDYRTARDAGLLLDWEKDGMLDRYGAYLKENYPDALHKNRRLNPDNALYGIYGNVCKNSEGHEDFYNCLYIRWDLYARLGYPEINTLEDLLPILKDMTALASIGSEADIYGLSAFVSWDSTMLDLAAATAGLYGYQRFGFGLYNPVSDTYEPCIDADGIYIRCLKFYNTLYREGLLDPSSNSQTYQLAQKDYVSGRAVLGMYDYIVRPYNTEGRLAQGKCMVPIAARDFCNIADEYSKYGHDNIWCISSVCSEPELCMKLINWLYTPDGVLTNLYGPKDVNWTYGSDNIPCITEFGYSCLADGGTAMPDGYNGTYNTGYSMLGSMTLSPDSAIDGAGGVSYNFLSWDSVQKSQWYDDTYGKYNNALSDWREHTNASDTDSYIEQNGYTLMPATDFVCDEIPSELFLTYKELSGDICTNSWLAIYAADDAEFQKAVEDMQNACTSRGTYKDIMDFYADMLNKYRQSVS